jgi:glycosyltransferase involved in cell wall biosynthesis
LTKEERKAGKEVIEQKNYSNKLDFVFVGRLEDEKGVQRILNVFSKIESERIGTIHFVGDGPKRKNYEQFVKERNIQHIYFHGYLTRSKINDLMSKTHVFLLPSSASEGFPKVIAEAANYGLIPIVSDVSSIAQYIIDEKTGFVVGNANEYILQKKIMNLLSQDSNIFRAISSNAYTMAENFTYDHYHERILKDVLKNER